jgi:Cu/Ag efflux pump CusA
MRSAPCLALLLLVPGGCARSQRPSPSLTVVVHAPGDAEDLERAVALPLERALLGTPGVRHLDTLALGGAVAVRLELEPRADVSAARLEVMQRLQGATLPPDVYPRLAPTAAATLRFAVEGRGYTGPDLRRAADELARALLTVPGVSGVTGCGGGRDAVRVQCDPQRLAAYHLTVADVGTALVKQGGTLALRVGPGFHQLHDLEEVVVMVRDGVPVRLRDVAMVQIAPLPAACLAGVDGVPTVEALVALREDRPEVRAAVEAKLAAQDLLPPGMRVRPLGDDAQRRVLQVQLAAPASVEAAWTAGGRLAQAAARVPEVSSVLLELRRPGVDAEALEAALAAGDVRDDLDLLLTLKPRDQWRTGIDEEALTAQLEQDIVKLAMPDVAVRLAGPGRAEVRLYGAELDLLDKLAEQAAEALRGVPGAADVTVVGARREPRQVIEPDRAMLARLGLNVSDVDEVVAAARRGRVVGQLGDARFVRDVLLSLGVARDQPLADLTVRTGDGTTVPLGQVVAVKLDQTRAAIARRDGERNLLVTFDARGRPLDAVLGDARRRLATTLHLPPGAHLTIEPAR